MGNGLGRSRVRSAVFLLCRGGPAGLREGTRRTTDAARPPDLTDTTGDKVFLGSFCDFSVWRAGAVRRRGRRRIGDGCPGRRARRGQRTRGGGGVRAGGGFLGIAWGDFEAPFYLSAWGAYHENEKGFCITLITRLEDMFSSPELATVLKPGLLTPVADVINDFISTQSEHRILRISLKYLSFAHSTREVVANAIGRLPLNLAREQKLTSGPVLIFLTRPISFWTSRSETRRTVTHWTLLN
jgi:hypothetical protein